MADIATLGLKVDASGAVREVDTFGGKLDQLAAKGTSAVDRLKRSFGGLAVATGVGLFGAKLLKETVDAQNAMAQLEAAVKSTGGAAGLTVKQLDDLSAAMQRTTAYSDDAVKGAQSLLLTFTKIRGDQFVEATKAVADLATRMGGDLRGAAIQVGKALNDPSVGLTALTKSGVSFTDAQKEVIQKLFDTGRVAEAQRLILKELQVEFGGSAEAARNTLGGALKGLGNDFGDLFEAEKGTTSTTVGFINALGGLIRLLNDLTPWVKATAVTAGLAGAIWLVIAAQKAFMANQLGVFIFSIRAAFAAASVAGTGFAGVLAGLKPLLVGIGATVGPVLAVGAALAGVVVLIKSALDDVKLANQEIDEQDKMSRLLQAKNYRLLHGADAAKKMFGDVYGTPKPTDNSDTENTRKLIAEREQELGKLTALNKAYGQSDLALRILGIRKDAETQKTKDAAEHTGKELQALNRLTDGIANQKIQAERLAEVKRLVAEADESARQKAEARETNLTSSANRVAALRIEREEQERMTAAMKQGEDAVNALNVALAGERVARELAGKATKEQIALAVQHAEATAREAIAQGKVREEESKRLADLKKKADEARQVWKNMLQGMQSSLSQFFKDVFTGGVNSFRDLFARIKDLFLQLLADLAAKKIMEKAAGVFAGILGTAATAGAQTGPFADFAKEVQAQNGGQSNAALRYGGAAIAGFGVGYGVGSTTTNKAMGALGGAASGAATGFAVGGPVGAAIGAVAGLAGGILGAGKAAKQAARQMRELQEALKISFDDLRARVSGDTLAQDLARNEAEKRQFLLQINQALPGSANERERNKQRAEAAALFDIIGEKIKAAAEQAKRYAREDLQVRLLSAQGRDKEAAALRLQLDQERERAAMVESFGDVIDPMEASTLALLDQVHAQEKLKAATDAANKSALNMVDGYKLQAAVFGALSPRSPSAPVSTIGDLPPIALPVSVPFPGSTPSVQGKTDLTVNLVIDGKVIGKAVLKDFQQSAQLQTGDSTQWANIQSLS